MRLRPLAAGAFFFLLVARSGQVRSWSGVDSERKSRLAASHNILDRGRCNSNAPEVVVSDAYAATRGSILLHSFLASRRACFGKPLGDFIADAEESLVGRLPLECRMGHYSEALLEGSAFSPPVVGFDVELGEATKGSKAVQRMEVEPSVL
jgi:hypothetical protein